MKTFPTSKLTEGEIADGWYICSDPTCKPTVGGHRVIGAHAHVRPRCDYREEHDDLADMPVGNRCKALATHRIEWEDGRRYSYGCDAHLEIDDAATVKPARIVQLGGAK